MLSENPLQIFTNELGNVRVIKGEKPSDTLFCLIDVAKCLGYARPDHLSSKLGYPLKRGVSSTVENQHGTTSSQKIVEMNFIKINDVSRLICSSKLPSAKRFESWIFDEIIPSLFDNGSYILPEQYSRPNFNQFVEYTHKTPEYEDGEYIGMRVGETEKVYENDPRFKELSKDNSIKTEDPIDNYTQGQFFDEICKVVLPFYDEIKTLQQEIKTLQQEIKSIQNTNKPVPLIKFEDRIF